MRHWERAPRPGRGIIVTRASTCVYTCRYPSNRPRTFHVCDGNDRAVGILHRFIFHLCVLLLPRVTSAGVDTSRRSRRGVI